MSKDNDQTDNFEALLRACLEISLLFPEGVIYIGGIAVYLHTLNNEQARSLAETTHDADFYISIADMADLRDIEEVTPNRRLSKHQLRKKGFEFDIYTERHSALIVPYDQVSAYSAMYDQVRVASLEHLFVLKLEAYRDRAGSVKGEKDAKDLIRIAIVASSKKEGFNSSLVTPYLSDQHLSLIERVSRGPEFMSLARGNSKNAKSLRTQFQELEEKIRKEN